MMSAEKAAPLVAELRRQLHLVQEIQGATAELLLACQCEQPDPLKVANLLAKRQKLMAASAKRRLILEEQAETQLAPQGEIAAEIIFAIRALLEKTAGLDQQIKKELELRRDRVKQELLQLQAGKAAGKAYGAKTAQAEGFFLDSKEN